MNSLLFKSPVILFQSILFSLLIHWAAFNNFIFSFPIIPETHKPQLIFLGSILQASDIATMRAQKTSKTDSLRSLDKIQRPSAIFSTATDKPGSPKTQDPATKRTLKTVEKPEAAQKRPAEMIRGQNLEINIQIEPYKPLRFRSGD